MEASLTKVVFSSDLPPSIGVAGRSESMGSPLNTSAPGASGSSLNLLIFLKK
jgi:hypothetical protein